MPRPRYSSARRAGIFSDTDLLMTKEAPARPILSPPYDEEKETRASISARETTDNGKPLSIDIHEAQFGKCNVVAVSGNRSQVRACRWTSTMTVVFTMLSCMFIAVRTATPGETAAGSPRNEDRRQDDHPWSAGVFLPGAALDAVDQHADRRRPDLLGGRVHGGKRRNGVGGKG
jgi:hypothetical protein